MSESLTKISVVSLFVEDVAAAKDFYTTVFDVPVMYEEDASAGVKLDNIILNLIKVEDAAELIAPAPVASPESGGRMQLSIWVDDVDAAVEMLTSRGAKFVTEPTNQPWGVRTATFTDPAGHSWEVASEVAE